MHRDVGHAIAFADPRPGIEINVATLPSENGAKFRAERESNTLVNFSTVDHHRCGPTVNNGCGPTVNKFVSLVLVGGFCGCGRSKNGR